MAGYIGTKAVNLSTTGADINGNANVDGTLDVTGAFTSLGIDDNATSTAITIDASENVGIGTASPSNPLHVAGTISSGVTGTAGNFLLRRSSDGAALAEFKLSGSEVVINNGSTGPTTFIQNGTERMRIDSSGNVGIGYATPTVELEVANKTGNVVTSTSTIAVSTGGEYGTSANPKSLHLDFKGNANAVKARIAAQEITGTGNQSLMAFSVLDSGGSLNEAMRIDDSGSVLVGKTSVAFSTVGGRLSALGEVQATVDSGTCLFLRRNTSTGGVAAFYSDAASVGGITVTGSSTAYNTSSDYRLKENITPVQGAADIVKMMQPCTYTFKSDGSWHDGFLAHELQELHPRAVIGEKDAMVDEEYEVTPAVEATYDAEDVELTPAVPAVMGTRSVPDYQQVDYSKLTPILTAALKEALDKIEVLEAQNAIFETRLAALEATP